MDKESAVWDEHSWRKLILPQQDKQTLWEGKGYRWCKSPNVIPIEQWRRWGNRNVKRRQIQSSK
jgi:hypothetical protein